LTEKLGATPASIGLLFAVMTLAYGLIAPVAGALTDALPVSSVLFVVAGCVLGFGILLYVLFRSKPTVRARAGGNEMRL